MAETPTTETGEHPHAITRTLKKIAPAFARWPRWMRDSPYVNRKNALSLVLILFGAGVWWSNFQSSHKLDALPEIKTALGTQDKAMQALTLALGNMQGQLNYIAQDVAAQKSWRSKIEEEAEKRAPIIVLPEPEPKPHSRVKTPSIKRKGSG